MPILTITQPILPIQQLAIAATSASDQQAAETLAQTLVLPLIDFPIQADNYAFILLLTEQRLELRQTGKNAPGPVYVDFLSDTAQYRSQTSSRKNELVARAVGIKGHVLPTVIDATAGLGKDAFVLASLGCQVKLIERSPIVFALLQDGIKRASVEPRLAPIIARMQLEQGEASAILTKLVENERPDVVYLDPMFPASGKSALAKKDMQVLQTLIGQDQDSPALLQIARQIAKRRVVVKRPRLATVIAGLQPSIQLMGNSTRFDVYLV